MVASYRVAATSIWTIHSSGLRPFTTVPAFTTEYLLLVVCEINFLRLSIRLVVLCANHPQSFDSRILTKEEQWYQVSISR